MQKQQLLAAAVAFVQDSPLNYFEGLRLFEAPIMAVGSAQDTLYAKYKQENIIGGHFMAPEEWLPGAQSVIAFFLPFSQKIKAANSVDYRWPAQEWLHGRVEGQVFIDALSLHLQAMLCREGYATCVPSCDSRFKRGAGDDAYTANWSERHAAFACGLGTFGLARGIITARGAAGRLASLITELELPIDRRPYTEVYEYCNNCGQCALQCPAQAISLEEGKKHSLCSDFLDKVMEIEDPYFGCGKCQIDVPCMDGLPG